MIEDLVRQLNRLQLQVDNLVKPEVPAMTAWTATVTQSVAITITSQTSYYAILGPLAFVQATIVCGSAGTAGNAIIIGGWPAALVPLSQPVGVFRVNDAGTTNYVGAVIHVGANDWRLLVNDSNVSLGISVYTIANTDTIQLNCLYRWR